MFEVKVDVTLSDAKKETIIQRVGYCVDVPEKLIEKKFIIGPKKSIDGKVQWAPAKFQITERNTVRVESVKFGIHGSVSRNQEDFDTAPVSSVIETSKAKQMKLQEEIQAIEKENEKEQQERQEEEFKKQQMMAGIESAKHEKQLEEVKHEVASLEMRRSKAQEQRKMIEDSKDEAELLQKLQDKV